MTITERGFIHPALWTSAVCTSWGRKTRRSIWKISTESENRISRMFFPWCWWSSSLVLHPISVQRQYPSATFHEGGAFLPQENVSSANSAHSTHHKLLIGRFLKLFQIASSSSKTGWTCTVYFSEVKNKIRCDLEKFEGFDDLSSNHLNFMVKC